jgi:hypothetical protein
MPLTGEEMELEFATRGNNNALSVAVKSRIALDPGVVVPIPT